MSGDSTVRFAGTLLSIGMELCWLQAERNNSVTKLRFALILLKLELKLNGDGSEVSDVLVGSDDCLLCDLKCDRFEAVVGHGWASAVGDASKSAELEPGDKL